MAGMKIFTSLLCSALAVSGPTINPQDSPDTMEKSPVFPIIQDHSVEGGSSLVVSGVYVPGFDINFDGVFDSTDVELIKSAREKKRIEEEKRQQQIASEEQARKEAEEKAAKEEAERKAAEAAVIQLTVTEPPVMQSPEVDKQEIQTLNTEMHGVDVSRWQGRIDWNRLKATGVEFAMIKAGEGTEVERNFYANINGAKEAGVNCGVYWFSNAHSYVEAVAEANACLEVISQYQLEFPVVCDFEYRSLKNNPLADSRKDLTDALLGFLGTIESNGYYAMLYTNTDFSGKYLEFSRITEKYDIWFAGYSVDKPGMPCGIWQYSETGVKDGIDIDNPNTGQTKVDLDIAYKNYPQIMKDLHINGY